MANKVGEIFIKINGDNSGLMKSLNNMEKNIKRSTRYNKKMSKSINEITNESKKMGKTSKTSYNGVMQNVVALSGALATLKLAFLDSANAAIDFEYQLAKVGSMLNEGSRKFLPVYSKQLKNMSIEFGQGTDVLSDGLYNILSAQIEAGKAMKFLEVSAKAATAGFAKTNDVSKALLSVIKAYGLEAGDATRVADKLFMTVFKGRLTFQELSETIGHVVSTASSAGLSIDDFLASFSTISRIVGKARMSASAITGIMNAILKPSEKGKKALKELGVSLDTATMQTKGFGYALENLKTAKPAQLAKIFGRIQGLRGATAILKDISGYAEDVSDMANSTGMVQERFAHVAKTLKILQNRLKQAYQLLKVNFGNIFMKDMKIIVESILNGIKTVTKFIAEHKKLVKSLGFGMLLIAGTSAILVSIKLALPIIAGLGWKVATALSAIGVSGMGLSSLSEDIDTMAFKLKTVLKAIKSFFDLVYNVGYAIGDSIQKIAKIEYNDIMSTLTFLRSKISGALGWLANSMADSKTNFNKFMNWIVKIVAKVIRKLLLLIKSNFGKTWNFLNLEVLKKKIDKLADSKNKLFSEKKNQGFIFRKYFKVAADRYKKDSEKSQEAYSEYQLKAAGALKDFKPLKILKEVGKSFINIYDKVMKIVKTPEIEDFNYEKNIVGKKLKEYQEQSPKERNKFKREIESTNKLNETIKKINVALAKERVKLLFPEKDSLQTGQDAYKNFMENNTASENLKNKKLTKGFKEATQNAISATKSRHYFNTSQDKFPSVDREKRQMSDMDKYTNYGTSEMFIDPLESSEAMLGDTRKFIRDEIINPISSGLKSVAETAGWTMEDFKQNLKGGLSSAFEEFMKFSKGLTDSVSGLMKNIGSAILRTLSRMFADAAAQGLIDIGSSLLGKFFPGSGNTSIAPYTGNIVNHQASAFGIPEMFPTTEFATGGVVPKVSTILAGESGKERVLSHRQTMAFEKMVNQNFNSGQSKPNINVNIENNTSNEIENSEVKTEFNGKDFVLSVVLDEVNTNPSFKNMLR